MSALVCDYLNASGLDAEIKVGDYKQGRFTYGHAYVMRRYGD